MLPLRTERLIVRNLERHDIADFTRYRNLPEIARYQEWELPYTSDLARAMVEEQEGVTGPVPEHWVQLAIDAGSGIVGDLAVWLSGDGFTAMIGYSLAPEAQGLGYATEAAQALLVGLFELGGVHRVVATIDPENVASARVLERLGFRYEGRSVAAVLVRGEWTDDDRYAILAGELRPSE